MPTSPPLLRLRSDDQLLGLFRAGHDAAFDALHDRYRQRLFAYARQMLSGRPRQDAEDVMQDVFVRAYGALRADARELNVRAWLYRVAHNRCIDHLRRPVPAPADVFEVSRKPLHDPIEEAQRREDLTRLVSDIGDLPDQQRSALLMRELDGMSYADLAGALDVTVPAVKSLLVRARMGLVDAAEARDADCEDIRADLASACDRGVKAPGRARRHVRGCPACREYRTALRGVQRSFAALSPVSLGPLAVAAKVVGLGGAGTGAAAGGAAAGGGAAGGAMVAGGGLATVTACKVAAVVCTAAITAGGAVEARQMVRAHRADHAPAPAAAAPAPVASASPAPRRQARPAVHRPAPAIERPAMAMGERSPAAAGHRRHAGDERAHDPAAAASPIDASTDQVVVTVPPADGIGETDAATDPAHGSGGTAAPDAAAGEDSGAPAPPAGDQEDAGDDPTGPSGTSTPAAGSTGSTAPGAGATQGGGTAPAQSPAPSGPTTPDPQG